MLPISLPTTRRTLAAGALVLALLGPTQSALASTLSLQIQPRTAQEARALSTAIAIYSVRRDLRAGADIRQVGRNHVAQLRQSGGNNRGIIRQRGTNHEANLVQTGGRNSQVILQYGNGAHADVHQTGGQSGILIQFAP